MKFSELKKYLADNPSDNFYLAEGDDYFLRERAVNMIIEKTVTGCNELNITKLDNPAPRQIIESCSILPFMSEKRAVIIKDYYPKLDIETLVKYDFKQNTGCVLIISNAVTGDIKKRLAKVYNFIDCGREDNIIVEKWITSMFRGRGKEIEPPAAALLSEYCSRDMTRINTEIEKLAVCKSIITKTDIEDNVAKDIEFQIYMLAGAVAAKNGNAYEIIKDFALKGDSNYVQQLLMSLYSQFKRMFFIKDSKLSQGELSQVLNIKPYAVTMSAKTARAYSKKQLKQAIKLCAEADYNIKSGTTGAEAALYYVVASLIN